MLLLLLLACAGASAAGVFAVLAAAVAVGAACCCCCCFCCRGPPIVNRHTCSAYGVLSDKLGTVDPTPADHDCIAHISSSKKKMMSQTELEMTIDYKRMQDKTDERDPRAIEHQFPCFGIHKIPWIWMANPYGVWKHCEKCGIRCSYAPRIGSPANSTEASPMPADVLSALKRLENMHIDDEVEYKQITGKMVRSLIIQEQRSHIVTGAKNQQALAQEATSNDKAPCSLRVYERRHERTPPT